MLKINWWCENILDSNEKTAKQTKFTPYANSASVSWNTQETTNLAKHLKKQGTDSH